MVGKEGNAAYNQMNFLRSSASENGETKEFTYAGILRGIWVLNTCSKTQLRTIKDAATNNGWAFWYV